MPITTGRHSYYFPHDLTNPFDGIVEIGSYTSIARGVAFLVGCIDHWPAVNRLAVTNYNFTEPPRHEKIVVGNDVWIGTNAMLVKANVGHGAIVGAGAVVLEDVPPYAVAVGMPAKVKRFRFSQPIIDKLLQIAWWDWPEEKIEEAKPFLHNIHVFIAKYG